MRIALKYCGACNPEVDLARIGRMVTEMAQERGWQLVTPGEDDNADVLVALSGCPRICFEKEELRRQSRHVLVVAGKRLGWLPVDEPDLPSAIIQAVQKLV